MIARNPRAVLTALRRPPEARPAEDYTALWDAEAARSAAMRAAGEDETSRMDACPQCGRPWPSFEETLDRCFAQTTYRARGPRYGMISTFPLARRSATSRNASTPRSSG